MVPSNQTTIVGAFINNLLIEHKERYDIMIGEERNIFVLQQVSRDFFTVPIRFFELNAALIGRNSVISKHQIIQPEYGE